MFIIKFNNMIRNKWIWGAFATIVAVAFVGSDMSCSRKNNGDPGAGTLGGEAVPREDYALMRRAVAFEREQGSKKIAQPERETWERLAALKVAAQLGISVSDQELVNSIHADKSFHDQSGLFSPMVFKLILQRAGLTTRQYEEMVRRQITLARLEKIIAAAAWVPPATLAERVRSYTDSFTLTTAILSNKFEAATMELTDEDVLKFYEANQERYRQPDMRQVVYTVFKAKDYLGDVAVEEDEVIDFYDSNITRYVEKGTNGVETTKPLEEVRKAIEDELASEASQVLAYRAAADFSDVFFTNTTESLTFEAAAASQGLSVLTSRLFTATSAPVLADSSPVFVEAAFALDPESLVNRFSEAVNGGAESYVMGFFTNVASRISSLESIQPRVRAAAQADAADDAFRSELDKVAEALALGPESDKTFRDTATEQGLSVSTNFVFSFMTAYGNSEVPSARFVAEKMAGMNAGEICTSPIPVPEGALFFQVLERTPGDSMMYSSIRNQAFGTLFTEISDLVWSEWRARTLLEMKPVTQYPLDSEVTDESADAE